MFLFLFLSFFIGAPEINAGTAANPAYGMVATDTLLPQDTLLIIDKILISGNFKTKDRIILRELAIKIGDTISSARLNAILLIEQNKIFNTRLFVTTDVVFVKMGNEKVNVLIHVSERWYIYPVPILELADRNINEWWSQRDRDLSRLEYGFKVTLKNLRGRNEELRTTVQFGFTNKLDFSYNMPYIDKSQKNGLRYSISFTENNAVAYKTLDHNLKFFKADRSLRNRFKTGVRWNHRSKFFASHGFEVNYNINSIDDTIRALNPDYFLQKATKQRYTGLRYEYRNDTRDVGPFPLHGKVLYFTLDMLGIFAFEDIRQLEISGGYNKYTELGRNFFIANQFKGKVSFPERQPYYNFRGMGYGQDFVRGYEPYVIEGQHLGFNKNTLRKQLWKGKKDLKGIMPLRQFNTFPYAVYLKSYLDFGYVRNNTFYPENARLSNKLLMGGGIGLDLVLFYDMVWRMEYSINKQKETGFFLHFKTDI